MKVFITGVAGFIGYHTALKFKAAGHDVFGVDNFNNYYDPALKSSREKILAKEGVKVDECDIAITPVGFDFVINEIKPDLVIHLAARAGVRHSMDNADEYILDNIIGTQNLITSCEKHGVDNVIYASTSCVMNGHPLPWREFESLYPSKSPYGWTKACNEQQFSSSRIPNVTGLRFFTVYGPFGRPDMALFEFTERISKGEPITVFNNGDMKRDFTYVDDIVNGIELVSKNLKPGSDLYCIGNGEQVNLMDFVKEIEINLDKKATIEFAPMHPADTKETWSDTTKIQSIGYESITPIETGVKNFIEWWKSYNG